MMLATRNSWKRAAVLVRNRTVAQSSRIAPRQLSCLAPAALQYRGLAGKQADTVHPRITSETYFFSSQSVEDIATEEMKPIRILYGTQGGTAQIFSMQLSDALEEVEMETETLGLHESSCPSQILSPKCINVIVTSVAGVGEPPDNARAFYEWLLSDSAHQKDWSCVEYTVFGLGNQKAHPNQYNVIGKTIDKRLQELGAHSIHPMGLGDDGECIEDDFDVWLASLLKTLQGEDGNASTETTAELEDACVVQDVSKELETEHEWQQCHGASNGKRLVSPKYPPLHMQPSVTDVISPDLMDQHFYQESFEKMNIVGNKLLSVHSGEYGLREMVIDINDSIYEAGDHFLLYPKNSHSMVEAYLEMLQVDPHAIISEKQEEKYPHPTNITLFETLLHCIDLGATPSPSFSRELLGHDDINYKQDIALPRRTVLDLILESGRPVSLEQVLYNMPPMQPRYYSIASSPKVHPSHVYLTYRPVKYVSSRGMVREGVCTNYMSHLAEGSQIVAALKSNPTFRLPTDPQAPILLMAGGCGIAAIRAFLEERLAIPQEYGPGHLFLGFRTPADQVYGDMVQEARKKGVLTNVEVSYSSGCTSPNQHCRLVSETVHANGQLVWNLFENGGYTYLCGGARTFGAAIEREVIRVIEEYGNKTTEEATAYLQQLIKEGRFCEDLAD